MNVLLSDHFDPLLKKQLNAHGFKCVVRPKITQEELLKIIHDFDGLIIRSRIAACKSLIKKAHKLKFVARAGSGIENIDKKELKKKGGSVFSSPEANAQAVAEHTLGLMINGLRNISKSNLQIRRHIWKRRENWGISFSETTLGIIGFGHTGKAFAKLASRTGFKVLAYDIKKKKPSKYAQFCDLKTLQKKSNVISVHIPLNKKNTSFIDASFLKKCKQKPIIINTSRGKVVQTSALLKALKTAQISYACLDVLEYENQSFEQIITTDTILDELIKHQNVLITPHIAGWTNCSYKKHAQVLAQKITKAFGVQKHKSS